MWRTEGYAGRRHSAVKTAHSLSYEPCASMACADRSRMLARLRLVARPPTRQFQPGDAPCLATAALHALKIFGGHAGGDRHYRAYY